MIRKRHKILLAATLLASTVAHAAMSNPAIEDWQRDRLFDPTERQLKLERKGKVFIYTGLTDRDVMRALDEQFDRVDTMMFTNIIVTDDAGKPKRDEESGEVVVEDDGC
jgi:hypothetical protein